MAAAFGGAGVSGAGTIGTLTNTGAISGGAATSAVTSVGASTKAAAGAGVGNFGTNATLTNSAAINGGAAIGNGGLTRGGAGMSNESGATVTTLTTTRPAQSMAAKRPATRAQPAAPASATPARSQR